MPSQPLPIAYRPHFDGLRAVAISAVMIAHFDFRHAPEFVASFGVCLFYVLSGFLITRILLADLPVVGRQELTFRRAIGNFYMRRTLRLFPIYYAALAFAWVAGLGDVRSDIGWLLTYTYNIRQSMMTEWSQPYGHFWSLAVEEQFYLFWAPAVLLLSRRALLCATAAMIVGAAAYRLALELAAVGGMRYLLIFGYMDYLAAGAILGILSAPLSREAFAARLAPSRRWRAAAALACIAILVVSPEHVGGPAAMLKNAALLVFLTLLVCGAYCDDRGPLSALLASPAMVYLGRISYGVYVVHLFPHYLMRTIPLRHMPLLWRDEVQVLLFGGIAICIAALSWRYFEAPINALKDRFRGAALAVRQTAG